jgi:hypothetical protein
MLHFDKDSTYISYNTADVNINMDYLDNMLDFDIFMAICSSIFVRRLL